MTLVPIKEPIAQVLAVKAAPALPTIATAPASAVLEGIKAGVDSDYPVEPNMPKLGERVLVSAIFGRMCHPTMGGTKHEIAVDKLTPVTFDWWHANLWNAGRIKLGTI